MLKKYIKIIIISLLLIIVIVNNIDLFKHKKVINIVKNNFKDITNIKNNDDKEIGIIEIPIINVNRKLYNIDSDKNNVKYNVEIIKKSDMPDIVNGNFVLASHSGNGKNAYFKDLNKLNIDDTIYINYENKKYIYEVVKIYEVDKTGLINVVRNKDKNILTLVTCDQINKTKQIVIISELIQVE